ncbi:PIN domain-containing protein [uncultured Sphaerotilus sp.]|uniref:PIN domain-containing protein n=1 Tax=uncultured Sphaerotilus sp. TaxID=474984 RepID=UPI0030CA3752
MTADHDCQTPMDMPPRHGSWDASADTGRPPRVVIDSALVTSALVFGGAPSARLRRAWRSGFCRPMVCKSTLLDLQRTLTDARFGFSAQEVSRMLGEYLPYVLRVRVPEAASPGQDIPCSLPFVQLAMAGKAHVLVTSDAALLNASRDLPFAVLPLEPFLDRLRDSVIEPAPLRVAVRRR